MINRIHIFRASGSGTTTLAKVLSDSMGIRHFDTDDYLWIHTEIRCQLIIREFYLLRQTGGAYVNYILSKSTIKKYWHIC